MMSTRESQSAWTRWLATAEYVARRATTPPADVEAIDAEVEALWQASAIGTVASRALVWLEKAWRTSHVEAVVGRMREEAARADRRDRRRAIGTAIVAAATTALLLQVFVAFPRDPWSAIVPLVCGVSGVLAIVFA
jgi:hypothetical protein